MAEAIYINGYTEFSNKIIELETQSEILYAYFTGKKGETGSWCPDCNDGMWDALVFIFSTPY